MPFPMQMSSSPGPPIVSVGEMPSTCSSQSRRKFLLRRPSREWYRFNPDSFYFIMSFLSLFRSSCFCTFSAFFLLRSSRARIFRIGSTYTMFKRSFINWRNFSLTLSNKVFLSFSLHLGYTYLTSSFFIFAHYYYYFLASALIAAMLAFSSNSFFLATAAASLYYYLLDGGGGIWHALAYISCCFFYSLSVFCYSRSWLRSTLLSSFSFSCFSFTWSNSWRFCARTSFLEGGRGGGACTQGWILFYFVTFISAFTAISCHLSINFPNLQISSTFFLLSSSSSLICFLGRCFSQKMWKMGEPRMASTLSMSMQ